MIVIAAIIIASGMVMSSIIIAIAIGEESNERVRNVTRNLDEAGKSLKSTADRNQP